MAQQRMGGDMLSFRPRDGRHLMLIIRNTYNVAAQVLANTED